MKKILLAGLFVLFASQVKAQVTAVTILGAGSGGPGQSVPVTFVITNTNLFYNVNYDILFSTSSSVTNTAYSSFLKGPMVCAGQDAGYNNSSGTSATTYIQNVTVPGYQYSGNIIVIAVENQPYLTCASTSGNAAFSMVPTPTVTATNTSTSTATSTSTSTTTNTITNTPTITQTPTRTTTNTATATATNTATKTATTTATQTPTVTSTFTSTKTPTAFFTYTVTLTPIATNTPFYPQILANQQVQVTATGTPGGQIVWIPEPPGWGGGGGGGGSAPTVFPTLYIVIPNASPTPTPNATPSSQNAVNAWVQNQFTPVPSPVVALGAGQTINIGNTGTVGLTAGTTVNIGTSGTVGITSQPNSVTTPLALLSKVGSAAATATGAAGVGTISDGFQNLFFPAQSIVALGLATPITFGANSLSNYGYQIDIGTGVTNLTAYLLLSYDGGLNYPSMPITFNSITKTAVATTSQFVGATNMAVSFSAWTLSGTPTVIPYPVAR